MNNTQQTIRTLINEISREVNDHQLEIFDLEFLSVSTCNGGERFYSTQFVAGVFFASGRDGLKKLFNDEDVLCANAEEEG